MSRHLFENRWAIRVIATLARANGSRFVVLRHALGVSAESLTTSLRWLMTEGWIEKNPGYGHPLRPEYVLTAAGARIAPACIALDETTAEHDGLTGVLYRKWHAPVLVAVRSGASRFGEIETALEGVTPRALTRGLRDLVDAHLLDRVIEDAYPPRPDYGLTMLGSEIAAKAEPLLVAP